MKYLAIFLVRVYQVCISPVIGGKARCRFIPTCSDYSIEAYKEYGFLKGSLLTAKRLLRCHPYSKSSGYDPLITKADKAKMKMLKKEK